jgi:hypothetical protein
MTTGAADRGAAEPLVRWTAATRAKILPGPGNVPKRVPLPPAAESLKRLADMAAVGREPLRAGLDRSTPETTARVRRVLESYADPATFCVPPLDVETEAVRATTLDLDMHGVQLPSGGSSGSLVSAWDAVAGVALDFWEQAAGLGFAVEAALAGRRHECRRPEHWSEAYWVDSRVESHYFSATTPVWTDLRGRIAAASPDSYGDAEARAERLRRTDMRTSALVAFLFPARQDWCTGDARALLSRAPRGGGGGFRERLGEATAVLASPSDAALAGELAPLCDPRPDVLWTILHNLGPDAARVIDALHNRSTVNECARILSAIESPQAARAFVLHLDDRPFAAIAVSYLPRVAEWARPELEAASRRGDKLASKLLESLQPREATVRRPAGGGEGRQAQAREDPVPAEEARGRVPWFLVRPPWEGGRPDSQPAVELAPRPVAVRLAVVPVEHGPKDDIYELRSAHQDAASVREWLSKHLASGENDEYEPSALEAFPDAEALEIWKRAPVEFWRLNRPECVAGLIERFGEEGLPGLLACARRRPAAVIPALFGVVATELAEIAADAFVRQKTARPAAGAWLVRHAKGAATALLPMALSPRARGGNAALAALQWLAANGHRATLDEAAREYAGGAPEALADALLRDEVVLKAKRPRPLPAFWTPEAWARPLFADDRQPLPRAAIDNVGVLLSLVPLGVPSPALDAVRTACDRRSLAAFAWDLFEAWRTTGAARREVWALRSLGHLGDDEIVPALGRLIREWPVTWIPAYAGTGMDILAAMGSDAAIAELNGMAGKFKSRGLKDRAAARVRELAAARGLDSEQLADRVVPHLGLGADGSRTLSFGPRSFRVGFDEALRPFVTTASGERLRELPKPGAKDDSNVARAAAAEWTALKKEVRTLATRERRRMEAALCAQRRWSLDEFRGLLVGHPLLVHMVRALVWCVYGSDGGGQTFRVTEDRTFADVNDRALAIPAGGAAVGLPHPLHLPEDERLAWSRAFQEYEILQPFPQLGRPVFHRSQEQAAFLEVPGVAGLEVPTTRLLGLKGRGWEPADEQSGTTASFAKPLPRSTLQAEMALDPGVFAVVSEFPQQKLGALVVCRRRSSSWRRAAAVPLGEIDEIAFSELMSDVAWLKE